MAKKLILFFIVVLILVGGGFFYWRDQTDVRKLNKNLPEGIKVVKSLTGEYGVVNKIDGYEFKVPKEWKGIGSIEYYFNTNKNTRKILLASKGFIQDFLAIDRYEQKLGDRDLKSWVLDLYTSWILEEGENIGEILADYDFKEEFIGALRTIKVQEKEHVLGVSYFFANENIVYEIRGVYLLDDYIRGIISTVRW